MILSKFSKDYTKKPTEKLSKIDIMFKNTIRFIIVGGTVPPTDFNLVDNLCYSTTDFNDNLIDNFHENTKLADKFICKLNSRVCTSIIPCYYELTSSYYPHVSIPSYYFFKSYNQKESFTSFTNPAIFKINDKVIVGCSGENIKSFFEHSLLEDELEAATLFLEMGHIAPTTPDMLR